MKKLLLTLTLILCLIPFIGNAANHYIKQGASGSANGADWTNAWTDLPTTFVRGDTYYVADGTYTGHVFSTATSGTTLITIKKSTVADHGTETGYSEADHDGVATFNTKGNAYGIFVFSSSYWIIDGVTGGGPSAWTTGHGFKIRSTLEDSSVNIIDIRPLIGNITIQHADIGTDTTAQPACDRFIYSSGTSSPNSSNVTLRYCYFHDVGDVGFTILNPNNWLWEYNYVTRTSGLTDTSCTRTCCSTSNHGAGFEISNGASFSAGSPNNCGRKITNVTIRYNNIVDIKGSGWIGIYDSYGGCVEGLYIYGNLFHNTASFTTGWSNGIIYNLGTSTDPLVDVKIYNNTFANLNYSISPSTAIVHLRELAGSSGNEFKNNIIYNTDGTNTYLIGTKDYNASDKAISGDSNLQTLSADPFTDKANADFTLSGATTAGVTLAGYTQDLTTATRGSDGTWDRGAYEYEEGGAPPDTDTPDISSIVIGSTGTVLTLTLDEDVIVNNGTGFTLACDNASGEGLAFVSESAGVLTFNITGAVIEGPPTTDTCKLDYATVANGIEDAAGNDLESIGDPVEVTNNSEYTPTQASYTVTPSTSTGCSISPASAVSVVTGATTQFTCTAVSGYECIAWTGTCGGTGTTSFTSSAITGDCTVIQACNKISPDTTIGSGCAITVGSGPAIKVY